MTLAEEIKSIPIDSHIATNEVATQFLTKLSEGNYSREEDPIHHFDVYFALYNPDNKTVFITHHKKSGLWLFPGGHLDKGELTVKTLMRELREELGIEYKHLVSQKPFLLTITRMDAPNYRCKTHYNVWYAIPTDGSDLKIDPSEFHDTKWLPIQEARKLIVDEQNIRALDKIQDILTAHTVF